MQFTFYLLSTITGTLVEVAAVTDPVVDLAPDADWAP
jgi:hypothetical protein